MTVCCLRYRCCRDATGGSLPASIGRLAQLQVLCDTVLCKIVESLILEASSLNLLLSSTLGDLLWNYGFGTTSAQFHSLIITLIIGTSPRFSSLAPSPLSSETSHSYRFCTLIIMSLTASSIY